MGGELPACAVDLATTRVPHSDWHTPGLQPPNKLLLIATSGCSPYRAGRGIHRDQVDVHPTPIAAATQDLGELLGAESLIVDVANQDVFDGNPALGRFRVLPRRVDHFLDIPTRIDRHQLIAQLV